MKKSLWLAGFVLATFLCAFGDGDERFKDLDKYVKPADRVLSPEEARKLVELTIKALCGDLGERLDACRELAYDIQHKAAIPVLVAVASNPKEHKYIRSIAIQAMANIADKQVIEELLKIAEEGVRRREQVIHDTAFYMLNRLLRPQVDLKEDPPMEILRMWKEVKGDPAKELAIYRALWEWQKDKPIDMRKRIYVMMMRSWH
jgi:hypothetical protein